MSNVGLVRSAAKDRAVIADKHRTLKSQYFLTIAELSVIASQPKVPVIRIVG